MDQVVQIAGALAILVAFTLAQLRVWDPQSLLYLVLNFVGALVLAINAYFEDQWGFLLLEGVWAIVSALSLAGLLRGKESVRPGT